MQGTRSRREAITVRAMLFPPTNDTSRDEYGEDQKERHEPICGGGYVAVVSGGVVAQAADKQQEKAT